jgi:hypothetical protein
VFVAQNVYPATGRNINLTTTYVIRLAADTVIADLPYFGRAYVAPMNPSDGGIHFTSTKFSYTTKEKRWLGYYDTAGRYSRREKDVFVCIVGWLRYFTGIKQ